MDIRIVVFHRGWVVVGQYDLKRNELGIEEITITNGAVIRRWGTKHGIGEIASNGPTNETVLDLVKTKIREPWVGQILCMDCVPEKWIAALGINDA